MSDRTPPGSRRNDLLGIRGAAALGVRDGRKVAREEPTCAASRMFAPDELIAALSDGGVEYVLIGGLAVGAHGFPRATKVVDVVPAPDDRNLDRLANVLRAIEAHNFGTGDFDPAEFPFDRLKPDDLREGGNFVLATRLGRLDIMQWVPGIPGDLAFEHLTRGAITTSLGGRPVRICSRDDLIAMKRAAGRSQDLLDLEELGAS